MILNYFNFLFRLCRCLSSLQEERVRASGILRGPDKNAINRIDNKTEFVEKIRLALYASKIVSYAQVNQQNVLQIGRQNSNSNFISGFYASERSSWKLQMEIELRWNCVDVAWRMYNQISLFGKNQVKINITGVNNSFFKNIFWFLGKPLLRIQNCPICY